MVCKFLLSNNMTKTSACFIEECYKLNMPAPTIPTESTEACNNNVVHLSKDRAASIIQSFKSASRLTFMKVTIIIIRYLEIEFICNLK